MDPGLASALSRECLSCIPAVDFYSRWWLISPGRVYRLTARQSKVYLWMSQMPSAYSWCSIHAEFLWAGQRGKRHQFLQRDYQHVAGTLWTQHFVESRPHSLWRGMNAALLTFLHSYTYIIFDQEVLETTKWVSCTTQWGKHISRKNILITVPSVACSCICCAVLISSSCSFSLSFVILLLFLANPAIIAPFPSLLVLQYSEVHAGILPR